MTKGKNFADEEEVQLCRSYLHVGKGATTGTGQASSALWERATQHYNDSISSASAHG